MSLHQALKSQILVEAEKLISRHHEYHNALHLENLRKSERSYSPSNLKKLKLPFYWAIDRKFNPFYVKKHANTIAYSIAKKLKMDHMNRHLQLVIK